MKLKTKLYSSLFFSGLFAVGLSYTEVSRAEGEEKEGYFIFNPTPSEKMRDFATDRPDKTESAYTIDAGHVQHETDIINYSYNQDDGVRSDSFFAFAPNAKVGLTNSTDIQFIYQPYTYAREKVTGTNERMKVTGAGDLVIRLKTNMWGNDGGSTAGAVMPYVKLPTNKGDVGNNVVEGGIIFPFAFDLCDDVGMGFQTQVDVLRNDSDTDYYAQFINSATVSTGIVGDLSGYTEFWTATSSQEDFQATLDIGFTYLVGENTQLDWGVNIGITDAADDLNPFIGLSQRF